MSNETLYVRGVTAEVSLSASRYLVVKIGTDRTTVRPVTAITDVPAGIIQNGPAIGGIARVAFKGPMQATYGAAVNRGNRLYFNAVGKLIPAIAGQTSVCTAGVDGVDGDIVTVEADFTNQAQP